MHQCSLGLLLPVGVEMGFCEQGCARIPSHQGGGGGWRRGWCGVRWGIKGCKLWHCSLLPELLCQKKVSPPQSQRCKDTETETKLEVTFWKISDSTWISFEHITIISPNYFCFMKPTIQFEEVYGSPKIWATLCILIVGRHGICQFSHTSKIPNLLKRFLRIWAPLCILIVGRHRFWQFSYTSKIPNYL